MKNSNSKIQKNAIILAAGFGSRLVPLTFDSPKGLIQIKDEQSMIERQIVFLNSVGIFDITLVTGYLHSAFEEIKNKYNLNIIENTRFNRTNSLYSLFLAQDYLSNTYILNSDAWINHNYFNTEQECPYLTVVSNTQPDDEAFEWKVSVDKDNFIQSLKPTKLKFNDLFITGPVYFDSNLSQAYKKLLNVYIKNNELKTNAYWEECLLELIKTHKIKANIQTNNVYEIDDLNNLKVVEPQMKILQNNKCIREICDVFNIEFNNISRIETIKKGLTNNSFSFVVDNTKYVYRNPGKGTENIIDRLREQKVYELIQNFEHTEKLKHYNKKTFSKISYFAKEHKNVDCYNENDVKCAFKTLKEFHNKKYILGQEFNIRRELTKYLLRITKSKHLINKQIGLTRDIYSILDFLNSLNVPKQLCHIDFIPDNILINNNDDVVLIDFEYAGDCDPMIDIAAFATSAFYNKIWLDKTIKFYFGEQGPSEQEILRIYAYMALLGRLWWIWSLVYIDNGNDINPNYSNHMLKNAKFYRTLLKEKLEDFS